MYKEHCPYCHNLHEDEVLQMLCPMRPEQLPLSIRYFGRLASESEYKVTDKIRYVAEDGEDHTGVVYRVIAPGISGVYVEADEQLRYLVSRDEEAIDELIYPSAILSKVEPL